MLKPHFTIKIKSDGLRTAGPKVRQRVGVALRKVALDVQADILERMGETKSGRVYPSGSKTHTASAPGEAPAIDTSTLAGSIRVSSGGSLKQVISSNVEYAAHLEFGAPAANIEPRPAWKPALDEAIPVLEDVIERILRTI